MGRKILLPTNSAPCYALKEKLPFPAKNPFVLQISIMSRFWNKYHVICSDSSLISFLLVQSSQHLKHVAAESQKRFRQLGGSFFNTLAQNSANRSPRASLPPHSATFHLFIQLYVLAASVRSPRHPLSNWEYTQLCISETCPVTSSSIPATAGWAHLFLFHCFNTNYRSCLVFHVSRCLGEKWSKLSKVSYFLDLYILL